MSRHAHIAHISETFAPLLGKVVHTVSEHTNSFVVQNSNNHISELKKKL